MFELKASTYAIGYYWRFLLIALIETKAFLDLLTFDHHLIHEYQKIGRTLKLQFSFISTSALQGLDCLFNLRLIYKMSNLPRFAFTSSASFHTLLDDFLNRL